MTIYGESTQSQALRASVGGNYSGGNRLRQIERYKVKIYMAPPAVSCLGTSRRFSLLPVRVENMTARFLLDTSIIAFVTHWEFFMQLCIYVRQKECVVDTGANYFFFPVCQLLPILT